jgi:hypothetical protein
MVCTIRGKHSHFCTGQEQSINCALMQHMTAVGHRHVRPRPTNVHLVNPPIERSVGYTLGLVTKKMVFLPTEPTIGGGILLSFRLALCRPHSCSKLGSILLPSNVVRNTVLTTELSLTGRSSAAGEC